MLFFAQNKIQLNRERKGDNYIYLVKKKFANVVNLILIMTQF